MAVVTMIRLIHPPQLTLKAVLVQIEENLYKTLLQNIFGIGHGFGVPVAYAQHGPCELFVQLPLSGRFPF